jgi:hypothetical protein
MTTRCRQFDAFLRIIKALAKWWGQLPAKASDAAIKGALPPLIRPRCLRARPAK